jgi:hypothetical protein
MRQLISPAQLISVVVPAYNTVATAGAPRLDRCREWGGRPPAVTP